MVQTGFGEGGCKIRLSLGSPTLKYKCNGLEWDLGTHPLSPNLIAGGQCHLPAIKCFADLRECGGLNIELKITILSSAQLLNPGLVSVRNLRWELLITAGTSLRNILIKKSSSTPQEKDKSPEGK